MAKTAFGNLYKVTSKANWSESILKAGNLVFGHFDDQYKIYANGIEYNIADASVYEKLINDLSTYVHEEVDSSITNLDSSVNAIEKWESELLLAAKENKISIEGIDGSVAFAGSNYVAVSTKDDTITVSIDSSVKHGAKETEAEDAFLATKGYVDEAVEAAEGDLSDVSARLNDLSTYVRTEVDGSINRLDSSVSALETWKEVVDSSFVAVDASLKAAMKDAALSADASDNKANITLTDTFESGLETTDTVSLEGDNYIKLSEEDDAIKFALNVINASNGIADASTTNDVSVTSAYAVKSYVEYKLGDLANALVFRGGVKSAEELASKTATAKVGDTYVATASWDGVDSGDLFIWNGTEWIHVERNLDGAVTSEDVLHEDHIVLGASETGQTVKISDFTIGTDDSTEIGDNSIATEKFVDSYVKAAITVEDASMKEYVDGEVDSLDASIKENQADIADLSTRLEKAGITITDDAYINSSVVKTGDSYAIDLSLNTVTDKAGIAAGSADELATASAVKEYVDEAGGKLSAKAGVADASAEIDLTASAEGSAEGGLGKVFVESSDSSLLKVNGADNKITLDLSVATMADASDGATGLALAEDVYKVITDNEKVEAEAIEAIQESVGLTSTLETNWDGTFADGETITQAIIDLSTDLAAANASLDEKIASAIDASIKLLDVDDTYAADKVLIGVSETDGKVASSAAGLEINGQAFATAADKSKLSVTIDGADIKVAGESKYADVSIAKAILDLSTAIDNIGDNLIEGEEALEPEAGKTSAIDDYVAVTATKDEATGNVQLDSSVLVADQVDIADVSGYTKAEATGLATDAYVKDYVASELAWVEL